MYEIIGIILFLFAIIATKKLRKFKNKKIKNIISNNDKLKFKELINENKELKKHKNLFFVILFIFVFMLIINIVFFEKMDIMISVITFLTIIYLMKLILGLLYKRYVMCYKKNIISKVLLDIDSSIEYYPEKGITYDEYRFANFEQFSGLKSSDLIIGKINEKNFRFSNILSYDYYNSGDRYRTGKSFSGAILSVNLQQNLNSFLYIVNKKIIINDKYLLRVNDSKFQQRYDILTDNKNLYNKILTPNFMNKIIEFENETGIYFEFKIYNDIIYFKFYTKKIFEPSLINEGNIDLSISVLKNIQKITKYILDNIDKL